MSVQRVLMSRTVLSAAVVVAVSLAMGCSAAQSVKHGVEDDAVAFEDYPNVVAQDGYFKTLRVSRKIEDRGFDARTGQETKPLRVIVWVRNIRKPRVEIQYRFTFLDANGIPQQPIMGWRRQQIAGEAQVALEGAAMDMGAADWRLEIRKTR